MYIYIYIYIYIYLVNSRKFKLFGARIVDRINLSFQIAMFCFGPSLGFPEYDGVQSKRTEE